MVSDMSDIEWAIIGWILLWSFIYAKDVVYRSNKIKWDLDNYVIKKFGKVYNNVENCDGCGGFFPTSKMKEIKEKIYAPDFAMVHYYCRNCLKDLQ